MSFDWTQFLELAEALESDPDLPGPREAALRSAVSRAYYAAFNCAVDLACREGFVPRYSGADHSRVRAHFRDNGSSDKVRGHISTQLGRLYKRRCEADYRPSIDRPDYLAQYAISMARSVMADLWSL
jgi:uncharacterized protein (UPF0332 family)